MITSLRLINWRSHSDTFLEFKQGTNLLMGIMGAGKSSVLAAICFSLFGTFPELERRKMKLGDVIRLNEGGASTIIELAWNGDQYKVERKIAREKRAVASDAVVYKNNQVVEKGAIAATKLIETIMQIDYDLFTRAIYSEQNNIDYFMAVDPRKRKEEIDVLLGLDRFETARANIISTINRIKSERKMLEERFSRLELENLRQRGKENDDKLIAIERIIEMGSKEYADTKALLDEKQTVYAELNAKKQIFDGLTKQKTGLESVIESLKKKAVVEIDEARLNTLKTEKTDLEVIRSRNTMEIRNVDQELAKLNKENATIESKINNVNRAMREITITELEISKLTEGRSVDEIKNSVAGGEGRIITYSSEKNAVENELKELNKITEMMLTGTTCPLCGSEVDAGKTSHMLEERKKKMDEKDRRLGELGALIKKTRELYENDVKRLRGLELNNGKLAILEKNMESVEMLGQLKKASEERLGEKQKDKEELQKTSWEIGETIQGVVLEISRMESLLSEQKKLNLYEGEYKNIDITIKKLMFDGKYYDAARLTLEETNIRFQRIGLEKNAHEKEKTMLVSMKNVFMKDIAQLEKMETDINNLVLVEEELAIYKNALIETQIGLRIGFIEAINAAMNEIWHIFYPYKDYKALRLSVSEKDYSFEIFNNEWKLLESVASGGERACAALTLRVALAMVLTPNLSMLILDEPTHNLDKDAVELLSQTLQFRVPEVVEQTFVITHEEGLMGSEFASSYKLLRDKEASEATKIERI